MFLLIVADEFGRVAGRFGRIAQQASFEEKPGKRLAGLLFVAERVLNFTVVGAVEVEHHAAVLLLIQIRHVGGRGQNLAAGRQQGPGVGQEFIQPGQGAHQAQAVHEQQNRVVGQPVAELRVKQAVPGHFAHAAGRHHSHRTGRYVHGLHVGEAAALQLQGVGAGTSAQVQHPAATLVQGLPLQVGHLQHRAEEIGSRQRLILRH